MSKCMKQKSIWQVSFLTASILLMFAQESARAEERVQTEDERGQYREFDASFLNVKHHESVDLSRFATGSAAVAGVHKTALYVNEQWISNGDIEFKTAEDNTVYPCLTPELIKLVAFDHVRLAESGISVPSEADQCGSFMGSIPEAKIEYDSNEQRLDIIIPQIYMQKTPRGSVSPELWDAGIPAVMIGYNVNGYHRESGGKNYDSLYAGLNMGLNIGGGWYLRHDGSFNRDNGVNRYTSINSYVQKDIPKLGARVLVGRSNTTGQLFDTLPFTGVQLATDERMLPESQRGYAPEIRGIARTTARVIVRQSSQVIYETTVMAGEFLINDLYPTGYGGDLDVTVQESDGAEQNFKVPYASIAQQLRPGVSRYAITAGELRIDSLRKQADLYQLTYHRGLTNALTGYTGVQASQDYYALQLGAAVGTPIGSIAFDVTQSHARLFGSGLKSRSETHTGQSYQLSYSKLISETNSNISLAAYRFSSRGFMDLMTALQTQEAMDKGLSSQSVWRAKNRLTLTAGQGLPGNWGQLYASGSIQSYWHQEGSEKQFQLGYSNHYKTFSYGVNVSRSFSREHAAQTSVLASLSIPLGRRDQVRTPQLRLNLSHDDSGRYGQQATVSGAAGAHNQYSYAVSGINTNRGSSSGSVSGNYRTGGTSLNASYSTGSGYRSASVGMTGMVVGHVNSVTFSPYNADTIAIVEAKGAKGARVSAYPGVQIDSRGYAIVPNLNPYQMNDIHLDPSGADTDVELESTSQKVAPYFGAVVKLKYDVKQGFPVLINATYRDQPVPFGASIFDAHNQAVGYVGQGGQLYARVNEAEGLLTVKWGEAEGSQCVLAYALDQAETKLKTRAMTQLEALCQ